MNKSRADVSVFGVMIAEMQDIHDALPTIAAPWWASPLFLLTLLLLVLLMAGYFFYRSRKNRLLNQQPPEEPTERVISRLHAAQKLPLASEQATEAEEALREYAFHAHRIDTHTLTAPQIPDALRACIPPCPEPICQQMANLFECTQTNRFAPSTPKRIEQMQSSLHQFIETFVRCINEEAFPSPAPPASNDSTTTNQPLAEAE